jgi:hypothetical protein
MMGIVEMTRLMYEFLFFSMMKNCSKGNTPWSATWLSGWGRGWLPKVGDHGKFVKIPYRQKIYFKPESKIVQFVPFSLFPLFCVPGVM